MITSSDACWVDPGDFPAPGQLHGRSVSLIITWFAVQRNSPLVGKFALPPAARAASPYEGALIYALEATGATGGALAWESSEEPGCTLQRAGTPLVGGTRHLAPGELDVFADASPALFDRERRRLLEARSPNERAVGRQARIGSETRRFPRSAGGPVVPDRGDYRGGPGGAGGHPRPVPRSSGI